MTTSNTKSAARRIMAERGVNYTTALRELEASDGPESALPAAIRANKTGAVHTPIPPTEILKGNVLAIDRNGRPAIVTIDSVEKTAGEYHEHAGAWYGGDVKIVATTTDGAVLIYEQRSDGSDNIDDFGSIERVDEDESAMLLADALVLDGLLATDSPTYSAPSYIIEAYGYDDDEDTLTALQRGALMRVLEAVRKRAKPAPTKVNTGISVFNLIAIEEEANREQKALASIAQRLTLVRQHEKYPKSTKWEVNHAITIATDAGNGDWSAPEITNRYGTDPRPVAIRTLLAQDWAASGGLTTEGEPASQERVLTAMTRIRDTRATASVLADLVNRPLSIQSIPKDLKTELREIVAELDRIASA